MTDNGFNVHLRRIRKEKGMTQEQLAERVGVSPQAVSKWEISSYPDAQLLPIISESLGVTIDELYGRKNPAETDMRERVVQYFSDLPHEDVFSEMTELCRAFAMSCCGARRYVPTEEAILHEKDTDVYMQLYWQGGLYLSRLNENLPFVWLLPRPAEPFDDVLATIRK